MDEKKLWIPFLIFLAGLIIMVNLAVALSNFADGNANLTIDNDGPEQVGDDVNFTAVFVNVTDAAYFITGADCVINFSDGVDVNMTESADFYNFSKSFSAAGNYTYNITCNKSDADPDYNFTTLNTSDSVQIILTQVNVSKYALKSSYNDTEIFQYIINISNTGTENLTSVDITDDFNYTYMNYSNVSCTLGGGSDTDFGYIEVDVTTCMPGARLNSSDWYVLYLNFTFNDSYHNGMPVNASNEVEVTVFDDSAYTDTDTDDYGIQINSTGLDCGYNISVSTNLTENMTECEGNGLNITTDDVVLDCKGYSLIGEENGIGIEVLPGVDNVTIRNCTVSNFTEGILISGTNVTAEFNLLKNNTDLNLGIDEGGAGSIINHNTMRNSSVGLDIYGVNLTRGVNISNNTITANTVGVYVENVSAGSGGPMQVWYNDIHSNAEYQITYGEVSDIDAFALNMCSGEDCYGNYWGHTDHCPYFRAEDTNVSNDGLYDWDAYDSSVVGTTGLVESPGCTVCGDEISWSETLEDDVYNWSGEMVCDGTAITMVMNHTVLDCDGFDIVGDYAGSGVGINISAHNVTVKNCTIYGFDQSAEAGINITAGDNHSIFNNTIYDVWNGIYKVGFDSQRYNISDNYIHDTEVSGIWVYDDSNCTIEDNYLNTITDYGLALTGVECTVKYNEINGSEIGGMYLTSASSDFSGVIEYNNVSFCDPAGSGIGIKIDSSNAINLTNNTLYNNSNGLDLTDTTGKIVYHNNIYNNSGYQVNAAGLIELSLNGEGNFWGRTSCPTFIASTDSNAANVIDSNAYADINGWTTGGDIPTCCGATITSSTTLTSDLPGCTATGITVAGNDTVLDCDGHYISGDYAGSGVGINISAHNVTVKNCTIYGFDQSAEAGINITAGDNHTIFNNTIYDVWNGIYKADFDSQRYNISDNYIHDTEVSGIWVYDDNNCTIEDNYLDTITDYGLALTGADCAVRYNKINGSEVGGMYLTSDNEDFSGVVEYNNVSFCDPTGSGIGIEIDSSNAINITNNTIYNNSDGLDLSDTSDKIVYHNNIYNNSQYQVNAGAPIELSYNGEGNYWGHDSCPTFIASDSNAGPVIDSYAYAELNAWYTGADIPICCGAVITSSTTLTSDLPGCTATGITVTSGDVVLDCDGHYISGNYDGSGFGINISGQANNVTIKNCTIYGFNMTNEAGILIETGDNHSIYNNTFYDDQFSIADYLSGTVCSLETQGINISDNYIINASNAGITLWCANNSVISDNDINDIAVDAIRARYTGEIYHNTIDTAGGQGINLSWSTDPGFTGSVYSNTIIDIIGTGITTDKNTLLDIYNNTLDNNNIGIYTAANGTISYNLINGSTTNGIEAAYVSSSVTYSGLITGNNVSFSGTGIKGGSTYFTNLTNNTVFNNTDGVILSYDGPNKVWHNNIYNNSDLGLQAPNIIELSLNNEGNYWGHDSCPAFIAGTDASVYTTDSWAYVEMSGWITGADIPTCCGATITSSITLGNDLPGCTGSGLGISGDDIVVDCDGHYISGDYAGTDGHGINITAGSDNVTIRNCTIYGFNMTEIL
ncbi:right-handed parallel beta-helix repeat-containing protein [Thermoproteota archaeon]